MESKGLLFLLGVMSAYLAYLHQQAMKEMTADLLMLRKTANDVDLSVQKLSLRLENMEDGYSQLGHALNLMNADRKEFRQEIQMLKASAEKSSSCMENTKMLKKSANDLDVSVQKVSLRLQNVEYKSSWMEDSLNKIFRNHEEFREQIQRFKHQVEDFQRTSRQRHPLWEALSDIFNFFLSPPERALLN